MKCTFLFVKHFREPHLVSIVQLQELSFEDFLRVVMTLRGSNAVTLKDRPLWVYIYVIIYVYFYRHSDKHIVLLSFSNLPDTEYQYIDGNGKTQ